jgi:hypothetical protein
MGSKRRETGWSLSAVIVGELRGFVQGVPEEDAPTLNGLCPLGDISDERTGMNTPPVDLL